MSDPISAMLLDESVEFSLPEVCAACSVTEDYILEIVAEGIVELIYRRRLAVAEERAALA